MATTSDPDVVYRCACSWVGGDPDRIQINPRTCPRCLCTRTHRCKTGCCLHCNRCDHVWIPSEYKAVYAFTCPACLHHDKKRVAVWVEGTPPIVLREIARPLPDLFKEDSKSKVMCVLRFVLEKGEVSAAVFKQAHVELGGTKHSTHAFDRYFEDKVQHGYNDYVPRSGNHGLLRRIVEPGQRPIKKNGRVKWIGSEGATFFERARGWFDRMTLTPEAHADLLSELEARVLAEQSEGSREIALTWYRAAQTATPTVRSPVRKASTRTSRKRNARQGTNKVPAQAA